MSSKPQLHLTSGDPTNFFETFLKNRNIVSNPETPSCKSFSSLSKPQKNSFQKKKLTLSVKKPEKKKIISKEKHINNNKIQKEADQEIKQFPLVLQNNLQMFLMKIRKFGYLNNPSILKESDLKIINDLAYFRQEKKKSRKKFNLGQIYENLLFNFDDKFRFLINFFPFKNMKIIHPYNKFKLLWDLMISLIIIFLLFYIPFSNSFDIDILANNAKFLISIMLIIDMILEMNTFYFQNGLEVRDRSEIVQNYLKSYFLPDFLALLAFCLQIKDFGIKFHEILGLFFFLKIINLKKISQKMINRFQLSCKWKGIKNLIFLFFVIILITHLAACGWYFVGISSENHNNFNTWIINEGLLHEPWYIKFLSSFYWSIVTIMTVGYGDIVPQNNIERCFCMLIILFGGMILPYSINSIGLIIQDMRKEQKKFDNTLDIINSFMRRKNINPDLQTRVREYLNFLWKEEKSQNMEEEIKIINTLSNSLKEELNLESFGFFLKNNSLFTKFFSESTLKKMVNAMIEIFNTPDDTIYVQNQKDENAFYFIEKGKVKIYSENSNKQLILLKELKKGDYFGERSFFTSFNRENTAISDKFTTLFMIKQDDFLSILKENKNDFENFMMIKERLLFSNDYSSINKKCFSCKQFDHIIEECPKLHFVPNIEKIIKRYNYPFLNERAKHIRKNNKSQNALLSIKIIKKNFSGFNKRIKIIKKEVKYGELDNSELNYSLEEEEKNELEEQKNNLNNNDSIAKLESLIPFSLSLPEENPEINIKNINVSNQNDLNELQIPNESFSSSILNTSQKNIEPQHSLNKTLSHTNSFKIDEQILNNPSNNNLKAIEPNSFKKIESNKTFEQSSENHRNSTIKCQNVVYNEIEIDKVYNFNNYFVDFNIETFSKNLPWFLYKEKQIMRRYLKKKYSKFKDYTFFGSRFLCKLNKEFICKRKKMKNIVSPELTIKLEKEETLKTNSKIKKLTLSSNNNSPLKKKTYFGKMEDNDEKINDFSQLFKAVMEKKKKKINKSHLSGNKN